MSGEQRSLSEMLLHDVRSGKRDAYL